VTERDLLVDCLRRLNGAGVSYMLTGSMASNYWGIPRTTHDLDFVVQLPPTSIPAVVAAFRENFYIDEVAVRGAYRPPYQFNALDQRSALKVDFWMLRPEPFEQEMFKRRVPVTLFGVPAHVATAEDVVLHKLFWNGITSSDRQLTDAAGVVLVQADKLDRSYLRHWAGALQVTGTLDDLLTGRITPKQT
jgi:hypothetical protein